MKKGILVTGATGNVGREVIRALKEAGAVQVYAGLRQPEADTYPLPPGVERVRFDVTDPHSFAPALASCSSLFLLRPPQISDVNRYFAPLIRAAKEAGVLHLVFLSVQGAEKNSFIPHHKIEDLVRQSGIPFTFLRPAYFMQNFTTTLLPDLRDHHRIFLPAGNAQFTLVDVRDVGRVAAQVLLHSHEFHGQAIDLTSEDLLSFEEMAEQVRDVTGLPVRYESPNLIRFFRMKRREGIPRPLILVMIMLHYLPRFTKAPQRSGAIERLTGKRPVSFRQFLLDHSGPGQPLSATNTG